MTTVTALPAHTRNVLAAAAEALVIFQATSRELFSAVHEHRWSEDHPDAELERDQLDNLYRLVGSSCAMSRRAIEWKRADARPEMDLAAAHTAVSRAKQAVGHELATSRFSDAGLHGTLSSCHVALCIMERLLGLARDGR